MVRHLMGGRMTYLYDGDMGISETREFTRADNIKQTAYGCVVFVEGNGKWEPAEPCMPTIVLANEFASNAKKIRVTVDIVE
jgi:hypothetical protein